MLLARERGEVIDEAGLPGRVERAVDEVVDQQLDAGLDLVNDGEAGKPGYTVYVKYRLTGFEGEPYRPSARPKWAEDFPEYYDKRIPGSDDITRPSCNGPISWRDREAVQTDVKNLIAALEKRGIQLDGAFMTAPSPGVVTSYHPNKFYQSHEAYLYAIAEVMKHEYDVISQSGLVLQIDCPDLTSNSNRELHMEVLNHALRDIPPEKMRLHVCWGNDEAPHHLDVPLKEISGLLLKARPAALSFEGANPRHEHEWTVFQDVKLPDDKVLIPGVIDSTTNYIEHPEVVAQRIVRYANVVGRENVIAGTDCGLATNIAQLPIVDARVAWAKLKSLSEGARLA